MSKSRTNQQGFGFLFVLLVVVVIGAIALVGMRVMRNRSSSVVSDSVKGQSAVPATVANKADLQSAATAIDTTNVDQVDLTQLDGDLNALL